MTNDIILVTDDGCESDIDCRGFAAKAYCEGIPKDCRFECKDSMHCANGICTEVTRSTGEIVNICINQCIEDSDCEGGEICLGMC